MSALRFNVMLATVLLFANPGCSDDSDSDDDSDSEGDSETEVDPNACCVLELLCSTCACLESREQAINTGDPAVCQAEMFDGCPALSRLDASDMCN